MRRFRNVAVSHGNDEMADCESISGLLGSPQSNSIKYGILNELIHSHLRLNEMQMKEQ